MPAAALSELEPWARELIASERVAHLGLLDESDLPRVLPVTYATHDGFVWTAVDRKPKRAAGEELARVRFLRRRPRAALTIDRYDEDWSRLAWVQLLGEVDVLPLDAAPEAIDALATRYPQYLAEPPPGPLLRLAPRRALAWRAA